ncbi:hypothetical protein C8Q73DRAFT_87097 [Cubamyces lactineus]|nr:hypothetical protein C8Q73DRAFT_87097 [Cubamyces lactineus]
MPRPLCDMIGRPPPGTCNSVGICPERVTGMIFLEAFHSHIRSVSLPHQARFTSNSTLIRAILLTHLRDNVEGSACVAPCLTSLRLSGAGKGKIATGSSKYAADEYQGTSQRSPAGYGTSSCRNDIRRPARHGFMDLRARRAQTERQLRTAVAYSGVATLYPLPTRATGVFNLCHCHTRSTLQPVSGPTPNLQTANLGCCLSEYRSPMPRTVDSRFAAGLLQVHFLQEGGVSRLRTPPCRGSSSATSFSSPARCLPQGWCLVRHDPHAQQQADRPPFSARGSVAALARQAGHTR